MSEPLLPDELAELLSAICDGAATEHQVQKLEALALADDAVCRKYLSYMALHGSLGNGEPAGGRKGEWAIPAIGELTPSPRHPVAPSPALSEVEGPPLRFAHSLRSPVVWSILAASLLFAAYFVGISWDMLGKRVASSPDHLSPLAPDKAPKGYPGAGVEGEFVATIRETSEVEWSADKSAFSMQPSAITANQPLSIQSGLVELHLKQGVTLVVEGPAEWTIDGGNSATLTRGNLIAQVPKQAIGFALETPAATIVDLGTEFGVEIGASGAAEVHVLNGLVNVLSAPIGEQSIRPVRLKAGQSVRIETDGMQSEGNPAIGAKLTRLAQAKQLSPQKNPGYEVLFHYRLGEDDKHAKSGDLASEQTLGMGTLGSAHPLTRVGSPKYTGETANASSKLALTIAGGSQGEGYVGTEFAGLPSDNFVLEAWVRTRSTKTQIVTYAGHPSYNGYGLFAVNGKWTRVYGSQLVLSGDIPLQLNEWTHLAFLRQRGASQLFVNGKASGAEVHTEPKTPTPVLLIGHDELEETFDGEIDEVRLIRLNRFFQTNMLLWKTTGEGSEGN